MTATTGAATLSRRLRGLLSLDDFERAAQRHLPGPLFAYVSGGAETNHSLLDNRRVFDDHGFVPRVLVDVSQRSTSRTLFGRQWAVPFGIAPMGISALTAYRGDLVLAQAAAGAGLPMIMSGSSLIPMETVAQQVPGTWFQAYLPGDETAMMALVERVGRAGFDTLVITVDSAIAANRENNLRAGFSTPLRPGPRLAWQGVTHPRWLCGTLLRTLVNHGMPHFENNFAGRGAPILSSSVMRDFSDRGHLNWTHLAAIRKVWTGRLVVKGLLSVRDARQARETGADGVILSNHGGRQLDGTVSPMRVLGEVVAACPDWPVMIDSGFRRGTDVLKALALGAAFVFVGRPFGYAAAVGGQPGVARAIDLLAAEISRNMAMLGVRRLDELGRDCLLALR